MSSPNYSEELSISTLQMLIDSGILSSSVVEEKIKMNKVKKVKEIHNFPIYSRKDGRVFTKINENENLRQIYGKNEEDLYQKLFEFYFGNQSYSLEQLYPLWMKWRENETAVSKKTIKENGYLWNSLLKDTEIVKAPLRFLKPKDFIKFFRSITKTRNLTRKRFNDMKSIMNGIIYYAVEEELIEHNYLRDINYRQFPYKPENNDVIPYSEEERSRMISHLGTDLYSLAIKLDFCLVLRIGELKALRFSDIVDDYIYIQRFMNDKKEIIEHIKGNTAEGKRYIPLTTKAKKIIAQIELINPDSEYLFIKNEIPLNTSTFNKHLRKCCNELNIVYRSSHKLRFSTASIMHKNGVNETELQKMLGHTTLTMTQHYLKNVTPKEETLAKMNSILD